MWKILLAVLLALAAPAYAQNTRANLTVLNNSYFVNCGTGCITGQDVHTYNAAAISAAGFLGDNNVWTGSNTFTGPVFFATAAAGYPFIATTAALSALPSTYASAVVRTGYYAVGDSPQTIYVSSGAACALNAGTGDGGSQIPTSDGKCWLAQFGKGPVYATQFGAKADGSTDDSTAENNAVAMLYAKGGGTLYLPADATTYLGSALNLRSNVFTLGQGGTVLLCNANPCVTQPSGSQWFKGAFQDVWLKATAGNAGGIAILLTSAQHSDVGNIYFSGWATGTLFKIAGAPVSTYDNATLGANTIFNSIHDFVEYDGAAVGLSIRGMYGSSPPSEIPGGLVTTLNDFRNIKMKVSSKCTDIIANADTNNFYDVLCTFSANGAKGVVQGDDPTYGEVVTINGGGSGYTASAIGTLTYNGSGCTTNPILHVATNSSGVITTFYDYDAPGICTTWPTASSAWTASASLGGGSGVNITIVNNTVNTYVNNNKFYGLTFSNGYGVTYSTMFSGGYSFATETYGISNDSPYGNYTLNAMTGDGSHIFNGQNIDSGTTNTLMTRDEYNISRINRVFTLSPSAQFGLTSAQTVGFDYIYVGNSAPIAAAGASVIQLPCGARDADRFSIYSLGGVTAASIVPCTGNGDHMLVSPTTLTANTTYHFRYYKASAYWIPD